MKRQKLLFVCTANKHRSPTAALMFRDHYGYETLSAGLSPDSQQVVDQELVDWADQVFCFESRQKKKLKKLKRSLRMMKKKLLKKSLKKKKILKR